MNCRTGDLAICRDMILTDREREIVTWYWTESHTYSEIASWLKCSAAKVELDVRTIRSIFRSHGESLPKFHRGRPRRPPVIEENRGDLSKGML